VGNISYVVKRYGIEVDLSKIGKTACPRCQKKLGRDVNCDNLHVYGLDGDGKHRGAKCFSCDFTIPSEDWLEENGDSNNETELEDLVGSYFDLEVNEKIKQETGVESKGYRGIRTDISRPFGVRYRYSEEDGSVTETFYPCTKEYNICGYKTRVDPKDFSHPYGETGKDCELFGQFKFKTQNNTVIIVGGEHDVLAAAQMLIDAQKNKQFDPVAVVSPTIGETGAYKQIQKQYQWFNQFKKIIVCMDNDPAGEEAAKKIVNVLPRGKVYVMQQRHKDPNKALKDGKEQDFINDFWAAQPYTPAGVHASTSLYKAALDRMDLDMVSLPPFMKKASSMLGNGLVKREITLILAKTSIGKTTLMSGLTQHLALYEQKEVIGVLSLEQDAGKFSQNLLSYHLKTPLHRMSKDERKEFLQKSEIKVEIDRLYEKPDGTPTLYVCDDRGANWEQIKEKTLEMIISMGVTILVVDPYSDLLSGMSVSEQEEVATWFKKIMKEYGITPIIVSHVRKSSTSGNSGQLTEDDAQGSSFLVKAAGQTIALERDKQAEDSIERNRTYINILKNRDFSETGPAGSMFFDIATSNLYDFDDWVKDNPGIVGIDFQ